MLRTEHLASTNEVKQAIAVLSADVTREIASVKEEVAASRTALQQQIADSRAESQKQMVELAQQMADSRAETRLLFGGLICLLLGMGLMGAKDLLRFL